MAIGIHQIQPPAGSVHRRKRLGRGIGSGHGKTSGKGHKGNKARGQVNPNFEGGQTPLHRRLPERRGVGKRNPHGFHPVRRTVYALVNVDELNERFDDGAEVTPEALVATGVLRDLHDGVKILGNGTIAKRLTVRAHKFSASARAKLEQAGGTVEVLAGKRD